MASGKLLAVLCLGIVMLAGGSTKAVAQCNCPGGSPPPVTDCVGDETVCGRWAAIIDCPSPAGAYGAPPWPACWPFNVEGIHAVLTHTGRVLVFNQTIPLSDCFWNGSAMAHFWDPGEFNVRPPANDIMVYSSDIVNSHKNLFCSGHAVLPDGRIIVVGGTDAGQLGGTYGTTTTFLFDPQGSSHLGCNRGCPTQPSPWRCMDWTELSPSPTMQYRRWYPTVTVLPNGQVLAVAGQESNVGGVIDMAEIPERFDRIVNSWTQFSGAANDQPPAGNMDVWYPLMFVLPGSTTSSSYVLHAGPQRTVTGFPTGHMQTIGNLQGASPTWANFGSASQIDGGGAVLYDKGRILKNGSPPTETFGTDAIKTGELINVKLDGSADTFAAAAPMLMERNQHNLVVLPDGTVFCSGGAVKIGGDNVCCEWRVLDSEIWTPGQDPTDPGSWRRVDAMNHRNPVHPRIYHSNALLLPDGRVLSTGGECKISPCSNTHYKSADFYEPPYLWEGPTDPIEPADRPTITSPPQFVAYGEAMFFQVSCGGGATGITKVAFVRPGSTTHNWNMDQRYVPMTFTEASGNLSVSAANMPDPRLAPPGYYMLFLVNNLGRPSVAPFVNLWGIIESSVSYTVTQQCNSGGGSPNLTFNVSWKTTIKSSGADKLHLYSPSGTCLVGDGIVTTVSSPNSFSHQISKTVGCQSGIWKFVVKSTESNSTSVSQCVSVQVTCLSCCGCTFD